MVNEISKKLFLDSAASWLCDSYSVDVRFIARHDLNPPQFWEALIFVNPLPILEEFTFDIQNSHISAGRIQKSKMPAIELLQVVESASNGVLAIDQHNHQLKVDGAFHYYSEMSDRDRWYSPLHLQISGTSNHPAPDFVGLDSALRGAPLPFDGATDLLTSLGFKDGSFSRSTSALSMYIAPPADIRFETSNLANNRFRLTVHAHRNFDPSKLDVAIRVVPGNGIRGRTHITSEFVWETEANEILVGRLDRELSDADSVLVMIQIGGVTARRQWFLDPVKPRNVRFLATQLFDQELKMLKQSVLESTDSRRFETGVASLLFLLGFSPSVSLETDSPDLIVATPSGRLAIVECTTRIADFPSKLGKLVDRRGKLSKALAESSHNNTVTAVLVCSLPADQIAANVVQVQSHQVISITRSELEQAFLNLRFPVDPDQMLESAIARLKSNH